MPIRTGCAKCDDLDDLRLAFNSALEIYERYGLEPSVLRAQYAESHDYLLDCDHHDSVYAQEKAEEAENLAPDSQWRYDNWSYDG